MAAADDTSSTLWTPIAEVATRAGSLEALLSRLRTSPIPARHHGLYSWPGGKAYSGPGNIEPEWWADAREDPGSGWVVFSKPGRYSLSFLDIRPGGVLQWADDQPPPPPRDAVFALGLELAREAAERLFPAAAVPATVEAPATAAVTGKNWLSKAVKRRVQANAVPAKISEFSKELLDEMAEAHERGEVRIAYKDTKVLEARLHEYKLWPLTVGRNPTK